MGKGAQDRQGVWSLTSSLEGNQQVKERKKPRTGDRPQKLQKDCEEGQDKLEKKRALRQRTKFISFQSWDLKPMALSCPVQQEERHGPQPPPLAPLTPVPEISSKDVEFTAALAAFKQNRFSFFSFSKGKLHTFQEEFRTRNCLL